MLDLSKVDHDEIKSIGERRGFMKKAGQFSLKAALATLPIALTMMPRIAKAQGSTTIDVLNFALLLEYLERDFYKMGLDSSALIPSGDRQVFETIYQHEVAHVEFLRAALGSAQDEVPEFDFTAGGMFPNGFTDYPTFLTLSQAFEDTGVRAYKGQAGNLQPADEVLTAALQIHSVEARHASMVRRLRGQRANLEIKGWITNAESNNAPQAVYEGEDATTHAGADLNSIVSITDISAAARTEAFDEPLTKEQVVEIVNPFIVKRA
ncbi:MAG TPA: ferritin-like domain-containing protein [Chryseosolibacter sp.]|nr:ferritin-like domain-containing protein [Chryseosolibacter sp.]